MLRMTIRRKIWKESIPFEKLIEFTKYVKLKIDSYIVYYLILCTIYYIKTLEVKQFITILKNPNQSEIEHAIEFNLYEFFRSIVYIDLEHIQYEETEEFSRFSTGVPFFFKWGDR